MIRLIIGKLSSIFRNIPSCKKEEQVVRGLIREAQTRQERDLAEPDSEVKALEIIRLVKSDSREVETIEATPLNRRFLIPTGGVLATLAIAWCLLPPTIRKLVAEFTSRPSEEHDLEGKRERDTLLAHLFRLKYQIAYNAE